MLNLNHLKLIIVAYFLLALPLSAQDIVDTNRLIDVSTLDQLNAIRYDLDGNGRVGGHHQSAYLAAFRRTPNCNYGTCRGYELMNDLNFNGSWAADGSAPGWVPIGNEEDIENLCQQELSIKDQAVIALPQER